MTRFVMLLQVFELSKYSTGLFKKRDDLLQPAVQPEQTEVCKIVLCRMADGMGTALRARACGD